MPQRRGVEPFSVHTTFQYSGAPGKTHRLREALLWHDEPAYYSPPNGVLVYVPMIMWQLVRPLGKMDVHAHFELVNGQLRQLRAAFLLAKRLKRVLVLPRLVCGLDRFWAPHNGTIPGSQNALPVDPCPADHVLDLEGLARDQNISALLREYSFLDNPRVPAQVRTSIRSVPPPRSLDESDLQPLRAFTSIAVLNLTSMPDLFSTLPPAQQKKEQEVMRLWTSMWCCSTPLTKKSAGHIHYDMFFDMIPHIDKQRREWDRPWEPVMGP